MKVDLYLDVHVGSKPEHLLATPCPTDKIKGSKRYKISVNIPDYAFTGEIDSCLPVENVTEVDKDEY